MVNSIPFVNLFWKFDIECPIQGLRTRRKGMICLDYMVLLLASVSSCRANDWHFLFSHKAQCSLPPFSRQLWVRHTKIAMLWNPSYCVIVSLGCCFYGCEGKSTWNMITAPLQSTSLILGIMFIKMISGLFVLKMEHMWRVMVWVCSWVHAFLLLVRETTLPLSSVFTIWFV